MKSILLRTATLAALSLLGACAAIPMAPAGPYTVAPGYSVTLANNWSDISAQTPNRPKNVKLLSIDGPALNRLYLTDGLAPGQSLIKPLSKDQPTPAYRTGMSPIEQIELVAENVSALGYERVETNDPRPAKFGGADAVRFDILCKTPEGLEMSGTAMAAEHGGRLYLILYLAPSEHYYRANLGSVEAIMASARAAG